MQQYGEYIRGYTYPTKYRIIVLFDSSRALLVRACHDWAFACEKNVIYYA